MLDASLVEAMAVNWMGLTRLAFGGSVALGASAAQRLAALKNLKVCVWGGGADRQG